MIGLLFERASRAACLDELLLATGEGPENDALAGVVRGLGFPVFRGSEQDVLSRYAGAARERDADVVVRLTGDCPFMDPAVIDLVAGARERAGADYATNVKPPTWPDGLDVSVFTRDILEAAHAEARLPSEREHVVTWMWKHTPLEGGTRYRAVNVPCPEDFSALRWTLDEAADYGLLRAILAALGPGAATAGWRQVLDLVRTHPELSALNQDIQRDAGLAKSLAQDKEPAQ